MPIVPDDDVVYVLGAGGHSHKILQPREPEPEKTTSTAENKNYNKTNQNSQKTEKWIKVVLRWLMDNQTAIWEVGKYLVHTTGLVLLTLSLVLVSNVGATLAYTGTSESLKWTQLDETTNDPYKGPGGGRNVSSIVFSKQKEMAKKNLSEIATDFYECNLGSFYFLGHKDMYKEHLTENENQRQPEQRCGVVEVHTIRGLEDQDCIDKLKFVCMFDGKSSRSGDLVYDGAIYRLYHEKLTWFQAPDYCHKIGGILATPNHVNGTDAFVMRFVDHFQNLGQKRLWIGLRRLDYCMDSTPALGIPWMEGEPNHQYPCVVLVRNVTGVVQAKTVNCSVTSSTDAPPTPSLGTGMISLIVVACVVVLVISVVVYFIAKWYCRQKVASYTVNQPSVNTIRAAAGRQTECNKPRNKLNDEEEDQLLNSPEKIG